MEDAAQQAVGARVHHGVVFVVGVDDGGQGALEWNSEAVSEGANKLRLVELEFGKRLSGTINSPDAVEARSMYILEETVAVNCQRKSGSVIGGGLVVLVSERAIERSWRGLGTYSDTPRTTTFTVLSWSSE